ncbi:hypothetical protein ACIGEZ_05535 [Streptomyces sp. NPDC085481]|uniref:hypothetical protein n=1 Tax=Streptomyces sp. NPDC085481 TaxID=3365727 RepID=UPI0037CF6190
MRASSEPGMRLAGLAPEPGGSGGGSADLKQSEGPWTHAAGAVVELRSDTNASLGQLESAHSGVDTNTEGLETTAALSAVLYSWQQRLKTVRDEAGNLETPLRQVAKDHGELENRQRAKFSALAPTPATGDSGAHKAGE